MPDRSYPYLAMAYYRIKRANRQFYELKRRAIDLCGQIRQQQISFHLNAETNELSLNESETTFVVEVPALLGVLVGETVYNLRCSLDYLIFDLGLFRRGGREPRGTQFPIESSDDGWRQHVVEGSYLAGLTPDDIAEVKRCQPCATLNGDWRKFQWLARFRNISNADKHRQWTVVAAMVKGDVWEMDVHVYGNFRPDVTLDDETPVVEALDEFIVKVKEVLDAFQPRFGGLAAAMVEVHDSDRPQTGEQ